ncbi:unnamed protein product [Meganyctiphanes norvegica]|uniref:C2H2-type domain-containing protein n=1 Tax=Meganyctiphanes norvegica TaxID=48144 RepID=A0AAV2SK98_MEGNR
MDISSYLEYELESIRESQKKDKCKIESDCNIARIASEDNQKHSKANQSVTLNIDKTLVNRELNHPHSSHHDSNFYISEKDKRSEILNSNLAHNNIEHRTIQRSQQCRQCHCAFKGKGHLKRHMMTHTKGDFQNQCEKCDFISLNRAVIELHMMTHTYEDVSKENPYICDLCKCECTQ